MAKATYYVYVLGEWLRNCGDESVALMVHSGIVNCTQGVLRTTVIIDD